MASNQGSDIRQAVAQFLVHPAYAEAMSLTTMQELFVRVLLSDPMRNSTTAAIRAGYSEKRARATARELLANPEVQLAIHEKETAAFQAADVDAAYVIMGIRDTVLVEQLQCDKPLVGRQVGKGQVTTTGGRISVFQPPA
jgi:hypothetical protein